MSFYSAVILLLYAGTSTADWIKLPSISPTTTRALTSSSVHEIPKVVFKLAPLPDPDIMSSETMSSVFSHRPAASSTTTTDSPSTKKSYIRKHFQSTVTSKVINFPGNVSDLLNRNEFLEPITLRPSSKKSPASNVRFYNKTVAMNVIPLKPSQIIVRDDLKFIANDQGEMDEVEEENEDDDDGVTISDEGTDVDEGGGEESGAETDDDYYEYNDEEELYKFPQPYRVKSTTTTEIPKTHKKARTKNQNAQRRMMIQKMLQKAPKKPFPEISFPRFINFIRQIQQSFALRTAKSIGEKIKMLMGFRDRLMLAINHQIRRLWVKQPRVTTTAKNKTKRRGKRTLVGGGGGGGGGWMEHGSSSNAMDFPSAEGALLSICFLTFAVFLIKLVLQVIHTIKLKKAMWATQMVSGGANTDTVIIKRRNERSLANDEEYLSKTLDYIHKLKIH